MRITAKTPAELLNKVYKHEGWVRETANESRIQRARTLYNFGIDRRNNHHVATKAR